MALGTKQDKTKAEIYMSMKKMSYQDALAERRAFWGRFFDDQKRFGDFKPALKREDWIESKLKEDGF